MMEICILREPERLKFASSEAKKETINLDPRVMYPGPDPELR